jgi:hypothetical protein
MKIILVSIFIFLTGLSNGQTNTYLADLASLKTIIKNTPSYKAQIKGSKLSYYNALYSRLVSDTIGELSSFKYFYNLSQLVFPLRDNHLGFYQLRNYSNFKTKESIDSFIKTKEFQSYPTCAINIDSLKTELAKKPTNSIEGIYHYDKLYRVGLFKNGDNSFIGVILDSDINLWVKGQIAIYLFEFAPNLYKAIYGHPIFKTFMLYPIEKYQNETLVNSFFYNSYSQTVYSKRLQQLDYVNLPRSSSKFGFRNINNDVQYLLIKTFQRSSNSSQQSYKFYDSIKNELKASYLILDLRNNDGGAKQEMKKYYKLLKSYTKHRNIYILLNNGTLSQAEIFILKLKRLKNVTLIGQTTMGMLSYGSNYGKRIKLPSGRFEIYPTDMKGGKERLRYEDYGINPDILLSNDLDWIEQTLKIIQRK